MELTLPSILTVIGGVLLALVATVFGSALSRVVADDAKAWLPKLTAAALDIALRRLPEAERPRRGEEWQAHLNDIPGDLSKWLVALGFIVASVRLNPPQFGGPTTSLNIFRRKPFLNGLLAGTLVSLLGGMGTAAGYELARHEHALLSFLAGTVGLSAGLWLLRRAWTKTILGRHR